jgi:hypothetical protein
MSGSPRSSDWHEAATSATLTINELAWGWVPRTRQCAAGSRRCLAESLPAWTGRPDDRIVFAERELALGELGLAGTKVVFGSR